MILELKKEKKNIDKIFQFIMAAQIASHEIPAFLFWPIAAGGAVVSP